MSNVKYYKVLDKNNHAKDGGVFDYTPFIKSGEWTPVIEDIVECSRGYHLTQYWNMFLSSEDNKIYEVEFKDAIIKENEVGVINKIVCKSFRFIKEIIPKFDDKTNTGDSNTGNRNTGDSNTGYSNTGDSNTGDSNTGNWNTGNWNTGNSNTGSLNTKKPKYTQIFNHQILFKDYDKIKFPDYFYFELTDKDYKKNFINSFNKATKEDVKLTLKIPFFNYKLFEEISGISKKMISDKLKVK